MAIVLNEVREFIDHYYGVEGKLQMAVHALEAIGQEEFGEHNPAGAALYGVKRVIWETLDLMQAVMVAIGEIEPQDDKEVAP